jgi:hypothetical protein
VVIFGVHRWWSKCCETLPDFQVSGLLLKNVIVCSRLAGDFHRITATGDYLPIADFQSLTQSASQAWAFYCEVAVAKMLWTVEDDVGYPAPKTAEVRRAQPFWSSQSPAAKVVAEVQAYAAFAPVAIPWDSFCETWEPDLTQDGLLVGVNWGGPIATGFDIEPDELKRSVQALIDDPKLKAPTA